MNISQKSDMKSFLDPTIKAISIALELPAAIWLFDEEKKEFRIVCSFGLSDEFIQNAVVSEERAVSVIKEKFENQKSLIVPDIQASPFWRRKAEAEKMNLKSAVASTLRVKTQVVGGLVVYIPKDKNINPEDIKVKYETKVESFADQISATVRNSQGLENLHQVGQLLNAEIGSPDFFKRILESVQKILNCKHVNLFIADQDNNLVLEESSSSIEPKRKSFRYGEGLAGYVAKNGTALLVADVRDYQNHFVKGITNPDIIERSMLLSPIKIDNRIIGIISADSNGLKGFDEHDLTFIEVFSNQASIAIYNKKLLESEREQRQRAYALGISSQMIKTTLDPSKVCDQIFDAIYEVMEEKYTSASIQLIQGDIRTLLAYRGPETDIFQPGLTRNISDDPLISRIVQNKTPIVLSDVNESDNWKHVSGTEHVNSWIGLPLIVKDNVIGLLTIDHSKSGYFTEEDKENFFELAKTISIEIIRNDLYLREKKKIETYSQLYETIKNLIDIEHFSNSRTFLKNIAESATKVLHPDIIELYEYYESEERYILPQISIGKKIGTDVPKNQIYEDDTILQIIKRREPLYASNVKVHPIFTALYNNQHTNKNCERFIYREKIESCAAIPLKSGNEKVGLMFVNYRKKQEFPEEQKQIIELFASLAAIAIKNVRLYERITKNQNLLRTLVDNIPDHVYAKDVESKFILANKSVAKFMGVKSWEYLIGKNDFNFHSPEFAEKYYADEQEIIKSGNGIINKDEESKNLVTFELINLLTTKVPLKDTNGKVYGIVGINRDVTERKKAERVQEAFYKISDAVHHAKDTEDVCVKIHDIIKELVSAKNFRIVTFTPDGKASNFIYYADEKDNDRDEQKKIINEGKTAYVFKHGKTIVIPRDREKFKDSISKGEIKEVGAPSKSWIGIPLRINDNIIGVLTLHNYDEEGIYGDSEIKILEFVSEQIAMAIERVQSQEELKMHHRDIEKRNKQQKVLIDLAQKLTSSIQLKEDDILQLIYKNASHIMDTENMYIALYDEPNDYVTFPLQYVDRKNGIGGKIGKDGKPEFGEDGKQKDAIPARKAGKGRTEEIIRTRKPIFIQTKEKSTEWYNQHGHAEYMDNPLASWIGVPMIAGNKVLGVVATYHPTKDYVYSHNDLEILQTMANIAAIALNNSRLVNDLKSAQNQIADRERDLVISMISMDFTHKINNLVGTIPAWVQLTKRVLNKRKIQNQKIDKYLNNIIRDVNIILEESDELRKPQSSENIDIKEEIGSIVGQIEMQTSPDIQIEFNDDLSILPVNGIKRLFSAAIHSVIKNGINAISGQGKICIGIKEVSDNPESDKKCIEINVSDTGCGLSQDRTESIFEHGTSFWPTKSTGYGLWRARNIIQSMGGTIKVKECMIGKGATFTIILPAVKQSSQNFGG